MTLNDTNCVKEQLVILNILMAELGKFLGEGKAESIVGRLSPI